jgi:hypothetical protein
VISVMKPWLGEAGASGRVAVSSGWLAIGPRVAQFERPSSPRASAPHTVSLSRPGRCGVRRNTLTSYLSRNHSTVAGGVVEVLLRNIGRGSD